MLKSIARLYAVGMITAAIATQNMPHIVEEHMPPSEWNNLNRNMIANAVLWPFPVANALLGVR